MREEFEELTVLINRINRNMRRIKNRELSEYNLKNAHISCLHYLYTHDGAIASNLCEECEEDKAAVSRALNDLEINGFIGRHSESSGRYKRSILLTAKGREAGKKIADMNSRVLDIISGDFSKAEIHALLNSLSVLNDNLEINFNINKK